MFLSVWSRRCGWLEMLLNLKERLLIIRKIDLLFKVNVRKNF